MAADLTFTVPTHEDIAELVTNMRSADRQEVTASHGGDARRTVEASVSQSRDCFSVRDDKGLLCIFGTVPDSLTSDVGALWMLGTWRLSSRPRTLSRVARRYADEMLAVFPVLRNWVDARNKASIRLIRFMGFTVGAPEPYGILGLPFHRFERRA